MSATQRRPGRHLVVFARAPRLGRVKRRLAADLGALAALRFHRLNTQVLLRRLSGDPRWTTWLATEPAGWSGREPLWPVALPCLAQGRGDIGQRMLRVFRNLPPGPAIIVGSDIPGLTPAHVERGFAALGRADMVLGPATDGGYWLVGLGPRARAIDPFRDVRWSSRWARADTARALPADFRLALVDLLADVDDGPGYRASRAQVRAQASDSSSRRAQASATHSISMSNSIGQDAMATKVRAGGSAGK